MYKKPVIVFEGIDGSGKTLHINFVSKYLSQRGLKYVKLREPGGSKNSEKIRNLILSKKSNFNKDTDLLLYLSARSENIEYMKKFYKKKIILLDRFVDSTTAYQHYGFGVNFNIIENINKYLLKNFKVNFTFLHIVNNKNMIKRLNVRKKLNRYDKFKDRFYQKVQNGFLKIAKKNRNHYQIVDSNLDVEINKKMIINKINKLIK